MNKNIQLLIIDPQNDFCDIPERELPVSQGYRTKPALPVTGADADMKRLAKLIERFGGKTATKVVRKAEEAAKAVAACRYPPVGMRSSGPVRAMHYGGADYVAHANDEIVIMAMIETKEGIANLDAICATPGLDAVYIGPADLSFALGLAPRGDNPDPLHLATCDKILAAAHKAGIKCVMHCASAAFASGAVKRGFDMVMLTSDLSCMVAGARMQLDELKSKTS